MKVAEWLIYSTEKSMCAIYWIYSNKKNKKKNERKKTHIQNNSNLII